MSEAEVDCLEYGHCEGDDGTCNTCGKTLRSCKECGDSTASDNLLCGVCDTELSGMLSEEESQFNYPQI